MGYLFSGPFTSLSPLQMSESLPLLLSFHAFLEGKVLASSGQAASSLVSEVAYAFRMLTFSGVFASATSPFADMLPY